MLQSTEGTIKSARSRAQATYDKSTAELEAIKPARSVAEVEALIAGAKPVCRIVVVTATETPSATHHPHSPPSWAGRSDVPSWSRRSRRPGSS